MGKTGLKESASAAKPAKVAKKAPKGAVTESKTFRDGLIYLYQRADFKKPTWLCRVKVPNGSGYVNRLPTKKRDNKVSVFDWSLGTGVANPRDLVNAAEFYSKAISMDAGLASAYRGLGLSLLKTGQTSEGQAALRRYLLLKPDASDAKLIRMMIPQEATDK